MQLNKYIDHTLLKPDTTKAAIQQLCEEAVQHELYAVCVPPYFIRDANQHIGDKDVKVATVIGFPMGYAPTPAKVEAVKKVVNDEVDEIDFVMNIAAAKNGDWNYLRNDISSVVTIGQLYNKVVKVIIETGLLTDDEIKQTCDICSESQVDYVKTSTGFNGEGATVKAVQLLRRSLPEGIKIKASGGIRERDFAVELIAAGADRLGSSSSVKLVQA